MILNGNQRGHGRNLALHLMKAENEVVQIHDLRGFVSRDLIGAFNEIHAISRATKCEQYLYSLSLNPPPNAKVSNADFEAAIEEAEKRLGLSGQPRAIVFHEKQGRRHCHVVWSRIDLETMKAKQMSFDREKLTEFSRELYLQYGWQMPRGLAQRGLRDPKNYSFAEHQQAQRIGKNAGQIKAEIQGAWAASDSKAAFESALAEIGYVLARGDRRSFVVVDMQGEVYSLPRMLGVKTKEVRARLGDPKDLPSLEDVQKMLAERQEKEQEAETLPQKEITKDEAFAEILHHHAAFTRKMAERTLKAVVPDEEQRREFLDEILKQKDVCKIGRHKGEAVYANQEMIDLENRMMEISQDMAQTKFHKTDDHALRRAIYALNNRLAGETDGKACLSDEQIAALRHMTSDKQLSLIVGVAGAGKTTIMQGAKEALESQGYRVRGAAPSGIAAAGLKQIGMNASTIHAFEGRLAIAQKILDENQGKPLTQKQQDFVKSALLTDRDVLIVDEAGMADTHRLARLMEITKQSGAKLVLVGDPEQLQSVEAGAAFRNLLERHDSAAITEVRRQKADWQREASILFSQGHTADALAAYDRRGHVTQTKTRGDATDRLVEDYMASHKVDPSKSRLVLAYTRKDVAALNKAIKSELVMQGKVALQSTEIAVTFKDKNGDICEKQRFSAGDRIVFRENNADMGVMNGTFGTLESVSENRLHVKLDNGKTVTFCPQDYKAISLGYAATIHKAQGVTVEETFVLATPHFDRNTAYVAMSRHKETVKLYAAKSDFKDKNRLYAALGKDGEKLSTLDFTDPREKQVRPSLQERLAKGAKSIRNRLFSKPAEQTAPPPQPSLPIYDERQKLAERDRVLQAAVPQPQPPRKPIQRQDVSALRDKFTKQATAKPSEPPRQLDFIALREEFMKQAQITETQKSLKPPHRPEYKGPTPER